MNLVLETIGDNLVRTLLGECSWPNIKMMVLEDIR
jgi:hypothetical protein